LSFLFLFDFSSFFIFALFSLVLFLFFSPCGLNT
jgi:hypothetical protein